MTWKDLVFVLLRSVPAGKVTTYGQVSLWAYGVSNKNQPVRSLLTGARNNGHQQLTNRVVRTDGQLADLPDGSDQQKAQLLSEGIPITHDGRVDFTQIQPVELPRSGKTAR